MRINADVLFSKLLADLNCVIDTNLPGWSVDSTVEQAAAFCLRDSLLKKFNSEDRPSPSACAVALDKFMAINEKCGRWVYEPEFTKDEELFGEVKNIIDRFWFVGGVSPLISDVRDVFYHGRSGPGASISARGNDFYTKMFDSPLSSTEGLPEIWERCVASSETHFLAEAKRLRLHGTTVVGSSKYSFVNKTSTVARGICTEPTINMWFQLGAGVILEKRLESQFGINLGQQPDVNRALARAGSLSDQLVTIDLESASDSMSLGMLRALLPRSMFSTLCMFRCPSTILPTGEELGLNMISTMGNGFTFPLMTMLLSAVVHGVKKWHQKCGVNLHLGRHNFGVFGDDIICPRSISRDVIRVLHLLGFVVNTGKSFVEGPFRESCGADFFRGSNVRGVYIKSLNTVQDVYVAINNLNRWTAKTGVYLNQTVTYLTTAIPEGTMKMVPFDVGDDCGLHTPRSYVNFRVKSKAGLDSYSAYEPARWEFLILGGHVWTYRDQVLRNYNPDGLMLSFLNGGIRGYAVSLRQRKLRYVTRRRVTPRWDYLPPRPFESIHGTQGLRRVVDAWHWNLLGSSAFVAG